MHPHTHTHARTHARTHAHTHARTRAHTHTHTHTHWESCIILCPGGLLSRGRSVPKRAGEAGKKDAWCVTSKSHSTATKSCAKNCASTWPSPPHDSTATRRSALPTGMLGKREKRWGGYKMGIRWGLKILHICACFHQLACQTIFAIWETTAASFISQAFSIASRVMFMGDNWCFLPFTGVLDSDTGKEYGR
jgi:hypothetical protein